MAKRISMGYRGKGVTSKALTKGPARSTATRGARHAPKGGARKGIVSVGAGRIAKRYGP